MSAVVAEPQRIRIDDWFGGLNLTNNLAPNESPNCMNMVPDDNGDLFCRLGYTKYTTSADAVNTFYSTATSQGKRLIVQVGAVVRYKSGAGTYTDIKTFSTAAPVGFCDFKDLLIMVHPVDGVFSWSGSALATLNTTVKGSSVAAWENKLWVALTDSTRLYWSAVGDQATWTTGTDFVDLRTLNDDPITALLVPTTQGLLAYKHKACHRVYDSTTGANSLLDGDSGAGGPRCVVTFDGRAYSFTEEGIFVTDGLSPLQSVSDKLAPLFHFDQLGAPVPDSWCMGASHNRIYLSFDRVGGTENDLTLEMDPRRGWIVPHSFGMNSLTYVPEEVTTADPGMWGAAPPSVSQIRWLFSAADDDGTDIAFRYQTPWIPLPTLGRIRRLRVSGRGDFSIEPRINYQDLVSATSVSLPWSNISEPSFEDLNELGVTNVVSFYISGTNALAGGAFETYPFSLSNPSRSGVTLRSLEMTIWPLGRDLAAGDAT